MAIQRIPLTQPIESRTASFAKDSRGVNCYFEKRGSALDVVKRPGLLKVASIGEPPVYPDIAQGQGLVEFRNEIISIVNNTVYRTDPTTFTTLVIGTIEGDLNQNWFVKTFVDNYLVFHNEINAYVIDKDWVLTQIKNDYISKVIMETGGAGYTNATVKFGELWTPTHIVTVNDVLYYGDNSYIVTGAGTTGLTAPTFTSGSAVDGTATLKYLSNPATATATIELGVIV